MKTFRHLLLFAVLFPASLMAERPNVVLILIDNHEKKYLGYYGHEVLKTPHIDKLSQEGIDFKSFYATPFCSPSRAALLTGRYALRYGIHDTYGGASILHKSEKTLANHMKEGGYKTAIFGKWHLGMSYPYAPGYRGFEESFVHGGGGIGQMEDHYGNKHIDARYLHNGTLVPSKGYSTDVLFDRAIDYIESNKKNPFFCFISTPATHTPYQEHPENAKRLRARGVSDEDKKQFAFYTMVENIDDNVGKILAKIDTLGLKDNTVVILLNDQEGPRPVYYMLRYPPLTENREACNALSSLHDVVPTVLDLCGLPIPKNLDGRSQRPLLEGAQKWDDDREIIIQCPRARERTKWKGVAVLTQKFSMKTTERLYLRKEGRNVTKKFPEVVKRLEASYEKFWNSLKPADELLSRHELGKIPTTLCGMDWYKGTRPWGGGVSRSTKDNGTWAVEVMQAGRYRFELRRYGREAHLANYKQGVANDAERLSLTVGDAKVSADELDPKAAAAVVELDLTPGRYDMDAVFSNTKDGTWGVYFAYISLIK